MANRAALTFHGLTADQLVDVPYLTTQMAYYQCKQCNFVSNDFRLMQVMHPCSHCQSRTTRTLWPSGAGLYLGEVVHHFYRSALRERAERERDFLATFRAHVVTPLTDEEVVKLARSAQKVYKPDPSYDYRVEVARIAKRLAIPASSDAERAYARLLMLDERAHEYYTTVVMTCTLLEVALQEIFVEKLIQTGVVTRDAWQQIEGIQSLDRLKDKFRELTGLAFYDLVKRGGKQPFHEDWVRLSKLRNAYLHSGLAKLKAEDAELAFLRSLECTEVFALVHNATIAVKLK